MRKLSPFLNKNYDVLPKPCIMISLMMRHFAAKFFNRAKVGTMRTIAKYLAIFLLAVLMGPLPAWARPTTGAEAQRVVDGWLAQGKHRLGAKLGNRTAQIRTFKDQSGNVTYFVINLAPTGFVIVGGDDLIEPIIAFAPQGTFNPTSQNPLYDLLQRDVPARLNQIRVKEGQARRLGLKFIPVGRQRRARSKWKRLQQYYAPSSELSFSTNEVSDLRVAPLVQSKWYQGMVGSTYCYNYYTPNHYLCGCVATALAQLMRYFSFPNIGVGPASFNIKVDGVPEAASLLGGDGAGGPYDWHKMVLDPDASITDEQRQAIGALTYDAGITVHMEYSFAGSGANNRYVTSALTGTFGYGNAKYAFNSGNNIPSNELITMIDPDLDARFPVILGITNETVGHEVLVDGYGYTSATLYHHLNLGYGGLDDAWYNLPTINTSYYEFTTIPDCIYNIFPQGSGEIISGRVLDASGAPISGATITASQSGGGIYTATSNDRGIYALAKIPSASTYTITASKEGYEFFSRVVTTGTSTNFVPASGNLWGIDIVQKSTGITLNQALDNNSLAFSTGGDAPWFGQDSLSFWGGSSARSGYISDNQSSWLQTTVVGPGNLSFYWKVSSETDYDLLELFVDDQLQSGSLSGEVDWQRKTVYIKPGSHIIKWVYSKDESLSAGSDCAWLDAVRFTKGGLAPIIQLLLRGN